MSSETALSTEQLNTILCRIQRINNQDVIVQQYWKHNGACCSTTSNNVAIAIKMLLGTLKQIHQLNGKYDNIEDCPDCNVVVNTYGSYQNQPQSTTIPVCNTNKTYSIRPVCYCTNSMNCNDSAKTSNLHHSSGNGTAIGLYDGAFLLANDIPMTFSATVGVLLFNVAMMQHRSLQQQQNSGASKNESYDRILCIYEQSLNLLQQQSMYSKTIQIILAATYNNMAHITLLKVKYSRDEHLGGALPEQSPKKHLVIHAMIRNIQAILQKLRMHSNCNHYHDHHTTILPVGEMCADDDYYDNYEYRFFLSNIQRYYGIQESNHASAA